MAFVLNHKTQSINVTNQLNEIRLVSTKTIQIPVISDLSTLPSEYRNTAIVNNSTSSSVTLLTDSSGSTTSIIPNNRLHFHNSNEWKAVCEFEDLDLIETHNNSLIDSYAEPLEARLDDLEIQRTLPVGAIFMWTKNSLPANFVFCDGLNGTPDLRNKFIQCKNSISDSSTTGGVAQATLSLNQIPEHKHVTPWGEHWRQGGTWGYFGSANNYGGKGGADWDNTWPMTSPIGSGSSPTHNNIPSFYAVAYIMYTG